MSTYVAKAYNPVSKLIEDATYVDDYYGRHKYGIRFDDGCVHPYAQCGLDAAATALTAKDKEIDALRGELESTQNKMCEFLEECAVQHERAIKAEARAKTAERENSDLINIRNMLILCGELGGMKSGETAIDYLRRLIDGLIDAERERDEARVRNERFRTALEIITGSVDGLQALQAKAALDLPDAHL